MNVGPRKKKGIVVKTVQGRIAKLKVPLVE
jgi:hypothetical protein